MAVGTRKRYSVFFILFVIRERRAKKLNQRPPSTLAFTQGTTDLATKALANIQNRGVYSALRWVMVGMCMGGFAAAVVEVVVLVSSRRDATQDARCSRAPFNSFVSALTWAAKRTRWEGRMR